MKTVTIPFESLHLNIDDIYLALGYGGLCPPENIRDMVAGMIQAIEKICQPCFCYTICEEVETESKGIVINGVNFTTGKIIASCLDKAESIVFFVATAGKEFENWLKSLHQKGDIWDMFLADAVGSEIAEATTRAVADELEEYAKQKGMYSSNSYSPGYCGWTVKEQQKLFTFFPSKPCGVTLTDSSLMIPIKSVSGIIGIGTHIRKKAYGCEICSMKTCYKKRASQT